MQNQTLQLVVHTLTYRSILGNGTKDGVWYEDRSLPGQQRLKEDSVRNFGSDKYSAAEPINWSTNWTYARLMQDVEGRIWPEVLSCRSSYCDLALLKLKQAFF